MKRKLSIYHLLVAIMMFSLILPGFAGATPSNGDNGNDQGETGSLTIHKFEQEPGTEEGVEGDGSAGQPADGTPLEGVTYKVKQTHSYDGKDWTAVTDSEEYTATTGTDGTAILSNLPLGRYSVVESGGPAHVNLNKNTFYVDIPMTSKDGATLNYNVHIYPKNETIRGAVELTKTDGDSEALLSGVEFELYKAGTPDEKIGGTHTTVNGKITVDNLAYGDYYFKEVATIDGYLLGSQKVEFSISESGTIVEVNVKNYKHPEVEKEVDLTAVNRGEVVTYTITVDLPGDIKEYKDFVVTDTLHANLEFVEVVSQAPGFTFLQDGQKLTWTATPSELSPGKASFTFKAKVKEDAEANVGIDNVATIDYTNNHDATGEKETKPVTVTPTAGSLKVIKQDKSTKERLAGAVFELRDADGNLVETGTTDTNGVLVFTSELDYGEYTLHETKAPAGYRQLTKPINVTINNDNHSVELTVDNSKSGWELPKTGGIGTILFTFVGLTLMGAALFMYIRRRAGGTA